MTNCVECGKPLKLIGIERKNGKGYYKDWKDNNKNPREYHKKCWREIQNKNNNYNYICQLIGKNTLNDTILQKIL